ncbi:MAG: general stress protein [Sulfuriferula sp.]
MSEKNSAIAIFSTHTEAEEAIKKLQKAGFDMQKLSIVGKDYHSDEHVVGYYNMGDRVKYWGKLGTFWGGLWALVFSSAFFLIPGIGPVVVGGPLVLWIISVLEGTAIMGGLSALGAALYSIGIPKDSIIEYETSIKESKFLLVAHGTSEAVTQAKTILEHTNATTTAIHLNAA